MPKPTTLPAASGYQQLASALKSPIYAKALQKRFYATTISGRISSQDIVPKELRAGGDEVVFRRAPEAVVMPYQKNQELEVTDLNTSVITMNVNRALYSNVKLDKVDIKQISDLKALLAAYREDVSNKTAQYIDSEMLLEIPLQASVCNKGRNAGKRSRAFDLGNAGAPVVLTADNIVNYLVALRTVLTEQNVDTSGLYVVFPTEAAPLFYTNPVLANACASGQQASIIMGTKIPDVLGFEILFSNNMPQRVDNGKLTYTIFAGRRDATGFVMQLSENEHVPVDSRHFGEFWRTLTVYDFKVIEPEAVAVLYATLDFNL